MLLQVAFILRVDLPRESRQAGRSQGYRAEQDSSFEPLRFVGEDESSRPPSRKEPALDLSGELHWGDLDDILKRRHLRVLTTFNRTNFFLAGGEQRGFEYSLLRDYEKALNRGRGSREQKVHMEFVPVHRDELVPKLLAGEGDIAAAGLTITPARLELVDFTSPYLDGIDEVLVTRRGIRALESLEDLAGREVRVRRSSSYYESLNAVNGTFLETGLPPIRIREVDEQLETEDILELVNAGTWGITVADSHLAQIWSGVHENLVVHENIKVRQGGEIAWMVRKDSPALQRSLNDFIRTHRKGTRFGNIYFNRYYKDDRWVSRPLAGEGRRKVEQYRSLFEKYSAMYGVPWFFTAAVAYQESGFDQSKTSRAGAVGIMQVLPSTAADKSIGIPDISGLENNIHAGVKYLALLRDRYFAEGDFHGQSRMHFVLASYNAGPGNITVARRRAPSWNVDPGRWFKNVENVVLRTISQEPVQYVVNINRYYAIFEQYFRALEEREELKRRAGN